MGPEKIDRLWPCDDCVDKAMEFIDSTIEAQEGAVSKFRRLNAILEAAKQTHRISHL